MPQVLRYDTTGTLGQEDEGRWCKWDDVAPMVGAFDANQDLHRARPASTYHEDYGPVLWWRFPLSEPPYCGSPLDDIWEDGYYTHWTPLPMPRIEGATQ